MGNLLGARVALCATALAFTACKSVGEEPLVDFGDNGSAWANDGECDDRRFFGDGMAKPPLMPDDVGQDANDCRAAWNRGDLVLRTDEVLGISGLGRLVDGVDFGEDQTKWAGDGECDDPRFKGAAMSVAPDRPLGDRTDCLVAYMNGRVALR